MKVESLGGESGDLNSINQKAKEIQKEAEYLLEKVKNGTEELQSESMSALRNENRTNNREDVTVPGACFELCATL